jgi:streptomycin 6-kinase/REP element-mobilizing transposase RayT
MDRYLDGARTGPTYLLRREIAELVVGSIHRGVSLGHYELRAWVLMANHVHVLLLPLTPPSRLMQSIKGYTARQANLILNRTGRTFWQAESYDHWVRDDVELNRIVAYIENNPVKAGVVDSAEEYRWSSAGKSVETILDAADTECPRHIGQARNFFQAQLPEMTLPGFDLPLGLKELEISRDGRDWLQQLPSTVGCCLRRWELRLERPYQQSCVSVVFPATTPEGSAVVLKIQFPHPECKHEAEALRRWNGNGAVQLLDSDPALNALLLERCEPGDHLSTVKPEIALDVLTELLPRLWIEADEPFVSLRDEAASWAEQLPLSWELAGRPFERELLDAALGALAELPESQGRQVLVHQDLHGDNVLRAGREPWLVIDPKPLVGEREFSLAPIVRSYEFGHSREGVIRRLDKLTSDLGLNRERARLWSLAQTLAWAFEGGRALERHVETARWLWQA